MNALIVCSNGFEEIETLAVADILRRGQVDVTIATLEPSPRPLIGARTVRLLPDATLTDCANTPFDALILPGGWQNALNLAASPLLAQILSQRAQNNQLIAAICASPAIVLGACGLPGTNRRATCYPGLEDRLQAIPTEADVVEDANYITSRGPATVIPFALAILSRLAGKEIAAHIASDLLFRN